MWEDNHKAKVELTIFVNSGVEDGEGVGPVVPTFADIVRHLLPPVDAAAAVAPLSSSSSTARLRRPRPTWKEDRHDADDSGGGG